MKKAVFIFIAAVVLFSGTLALALEFSADVVNKSKEGAFQGKIFVSENKTRIEMAEIISIARMDKNVTWVIMTAQKMYMEQPISTKMIAGTSEKMPGEVERTLLGDEPVDGRPAIKYRVVYESNGTRQSMLLWSDKISSIPLKVNAEDGSWSMEYKNLEVGPQDQSLFEIPEGYSKFAVPNVGS